MKTAENNCQVGEQRDQGTYNQVTAQTSAYMRRTGNV